MARAAAGAHISAAANVAGACTVAAAAAGEAAAAARLFAPRGAARALPGTPTLSIATLLTFGADVTRSPFTITLREPGSAPPQPLRRRTPGY